MKQKKVSINQRIKGQVCRKVGNKTQIKELKEKLKPLVEARASLNTLLENKLTLLTSKVCVIKA